MARFCPLFSGSSGNAMYFGGGGGGILIDVGMSAKKTARALQDMEIDPAGLGGILITHEHVDHVRGLRVFASRYRLKVYASAGTLGALEEQNLLCPGIEAAVIPAGGIELAGMYITPFHTSHDCREGFGYSIRMSDGRTAALATDLGYISEEVRAAVYGHDLVVIESNHDVRMLENGRYPYPLKRRILSPKGHLSNEGCACELPALLQSGATRFVLAHLSRENNLPGLAYQTALAELKMAGGREFRDFELWVAPREAPSGVTIF